jgi:hypothetical protein
MAIKSKPGARSQASVFMISNERPSPYAQRPASSGPKPGMQEDTLRSEKLQIERKTFLFTLKENPRGRFLRITEDVAGRRDTIIVPAPGLEEFRRMLEAMERTASEPTGNEAEEEAEGS